jgi:flagellar biosynthetic protein FliQ
VEPAGGHPGEQFFLKAAVMTPEFIIGFARQSIELTLMISLPMLGVGLVVGLVVSIFQAATQIQEMTLSFIPKIISIFLALLLAFPWIMDKIITYTRDIFLNIPTYIR